MKENLAKPVPEQPESRRKMKFGPFEKSYEEEPEVIPIREIEWCPGHYLPKSDNGKETITEKKGCRLIIFQRMARPRKTT